jgi:NIMA (never in mitosis gene a)-related kinase 1/4/5
MNKYEIDRIIGKGSYGSAMLCKRKSDGKKCIIKQISIAKLSKKELKATEQESCILAKLSHPNIVAFWESITTREHLNIVMEYADGGDLTKYIEKRHSNLIPESQVLHLFVQISLAIKHIHDRKILHRDLKTDVSMIDDS